MEKQLSSFGLLLLLSYIRVLMAFAPKPHLNALRSTPSCILRLDSGRLPSSFRLSLVADEDEEDESEPVSESTDEDDSEVEPQEDPEIVALKEEIAQLESQLKGKKSTLTYTQDQVEEYSKAGYARKVAEMENMRRIRSSMNSSSRSSATASILSDFLPVYDNMKAAREKYADHEFGSKFGGLSMELAFSKLGVSEYTINSGEPVDRIRMALVESEHSTEFAKDTVIRMVAAGMELQGNVIRAAECVASLGSEEEEKVEEEADVDNKSETTDAAET